MSHWLYLYAVACVPAALFGGMMAGELVYRYAHNHHVASYIQVLHTWEWIAAIVCTVPGFTGISVCQLRGHRKVQPKQRSKEVADTDDTVWPPAPRQ